jgi:hypothetical protein
VCINSNGKNRNRRTLLGVEDCESWKVGEIVVNGRLTRVSRNDGRLNIICDDRVGRVNFIGDDSDHRGRTTENVKEMTNATERSIRSKADDSRRVATWMPISTMIGFMMHFCMISFKEGLGSIT